jgi:hypothetical protein
VKSIADVTGLIAGKLNRTWASEVVSPGDSWPQSFMLGAPPSAQMAKDWRTVHDWSKRWEDWSAQLGVAIRTREYRVAGTTQIVTTHISVNFDCAARIAGGRWSNQISLARRRADTLRARFANADISKVLAASAKENDVDFDLLLDAATWFQHNAAEGLTPRQVPIAGFHTKWLNSRQPIVKHLAGRDSLGLIRRPQVVHYTYLDPEHRRGGSRWHDSVTIGDITLPPYTPSKIIICENKDSAIFFPEIPSGISIEGAGFTGAPAVASILWVHNCPDLVYWGDIDAAGFEILNRYRAHGLNLRTVLMDRETFGEFSRLGVNEDDLGRDLSRVRRVELPYLTTEERWLYNDLTDPNWTHPRRIEQERLRFPEVQ